MKKYDSNDLTVAFAIGFLIGIVVMFINIIYWFYILLYVFFNCIQCASVWLVAEIITKDNRNDYNNKRRDFKNSRQMLS